MCWRLLVTAAPVACNNATQYTAPHDWAVFKSLALTDSLVPGMQCVVNVSARWQH